MNYTDNQLKAALAKMLPELLYIEYYKAKFIFIRWLTNKPNYGRKGIPVLDTELLHLCWLVEEELPFLSECDYWDSISVLRCTWQRRVVALAKVKGIKI